MQAGYQVFAWAENQIDSRREFRQRYALGDGSLSAAPMFCVERTLKLLYFSALAYDLQVGVGLCRPYKP